MQVSELNAGYEFIHRHGITFGLNYRTDDVVFVSDVIKLKYILFLEYLLAEDIQTHNPKIKTVIFLETIL